jgi:hypothetical protein
MTKTTHIFKTYFPETNGGLEEAIRQIGRHAVNEGFKVGVVFVGRRSFEITGPDKITARFHKSSLDLICVTSQNLLKSAACLRKFRSKTVEICLWFDEERFRDLTEPDNDQR